MADYFKDLMKQGKQLLADTKTPKQLNPVVKKDKTLTNPAAGSMPGETNPHKIFVARAINEKLKAKDIVKEFQKICDSEDAKL